MQKAMGKKKRDSGDKKHGADKVRKANSSNKAGKACKANVSGKSGKASETHEDARPALSESSLKVKVCKKCCGVSAKKLNKELGADVCTKGCMGACSRRVRERCGTGVCARMGKRLVFAEDASALARTIRAA